MSYSLAFVNKENDPRLTEVLAKIKEPETKQQFFEKISLIPKKLQQPKPSAMITYDQVMKEKKNQVIGNLGIPWFPISKLDQSEQNKMKDLLFNKTKTSLGSPRNPERDWRQMKVMLPILKASEAPNYLRSDLIIGPKDEH